MILTGAYAYEGRKRRQMVEEGGEEEARRCGGRMDNMEQHLGSKEMMEKRIIL